MPDAWKTRTAKDAYTPPSKTPGNDSRNLPDLSSVAEERRRHEDRHWRRSGDGWLATPSPLRDCKAGLVQVDHDPSSALDHPTASPYTAAVIFIEAPLFSRLLGEYLSDDEYAALQWALTQRPEAGAVIPGSGGIRKLRWAGSGRGKRGGLRVIYYWKTRAGEIWLLTLYAKNEAEDIPLNVLRQLQQEIES